MPNRRRNGGANVSRTAKRPILMRKGEMQWSPGQVIRLFELFAEHQKIDELKKAFKGSRRKIKIPTEIVNAIKKLLHALGLDEIDELALELILDCPCPIGKYALLPRRKSGQAPKPPRRRRRTKA